MLCASQWAVRLISVVVFRFRQKGVKLSRSGVSLKLAVPSGCIEFRKPAPELRQVRGGESFDSLLQGFHIGHGLSVRFTANQSDANRLASPPPSNRQRRCTAKQQPGSHAAGIWRSSRFPSIGPDTDFRTIDFDLIPEGLLERCTIDLAKGTVGCPASTPFPGPANAAVRHSPGQGIPRIEGSTQNR